MKDRQFVEGLSNETRFLEALKNIEARGAIEANWMLVEGDPGYGKTNLLLRHSVRSGSVMVRAKASWTARAALVDIAEALNVEAQGKTQQLLAAVISELMVRQGRKGFVLIVDEINHAAKNADVLETLRDLTDVSECILIAGGHKGVSSTLKRYTQILSRVDQHVMFLPATVDDVRQMCKALSEIKIADDLVAEIHRRTQGRLRTVMGAISRVEAYGRRQRGEGAVNLTAYGNRPLLSDERANLTVVAG